jgi:hypothetical protein
VDEATVRELIGRDPGLASEIPADAVIADVHEVGLEEAIRLSTEYPGSFRRHKGHVLHAATISYPDSTTGFMRYRVVILTENGNIVMFT